MSFGTISSFNKRFLALMNSPEFKRESEGNRLLSSAALIDPRTRTTQCAGMKPKAKDAA